MAKSRTKSKAVRKSGSSSAAKKQDTGIPVSHLIAAFFIGFIMILSLYLDSDGIILVYLRNAMQTVFGMGAFILPVSIFGFIFLYYFDREHYKRNMTAAVFIFIAILVILDVTLAAGTDVNMSFSDKMKYVSDIGRTGFGGGVAGGLFSYFLMKLFGKDATIIISLAVIAVAIVVIGNRNLIDLFRSLAEAVRRIPELFAKAGNFLSEKFQSAGQTLKVKKEIRDLERKKKLKELKREQEEAEKIRREKEAEEERKEKLRKEREEKRQKPVIKGLRKGRSEGAERLRNRREAEKAEKEEEVLKPERFEFEIASDDEESSEGSVIRADFSEKRENFRKEKEAEKEAEEEIETADEFEFVSASGSEDSEKNSSKIVPILKKKPYEIPPVNLLSDEIDLEADDEEYVVKNADKLIETLSNFGIEARVNSVNIGPSITKYEIQIAPGIKVSRILNLSNDLALSLASSDIRIEAPIPGKSAIGIEIPNKHRTSVRIRQMIESESFQNFKGDVPIALGKDVEGEPVIADIEKMPHMLIAGATGSGKSVCINTIITSIVYKSSPDDVKLILVDPKVVELSIYNGIPHLYIPVVTNPNKAAGALNWAVTEMNRRYEMFANAGVRDIKGYNKKEKDNKLPKIVMIIDELSDLMMTAASNEVEELICRIAQMARAAGIHLIIATQRPSVDVITGTIKANIPSRISFAVSSQTDSRTILDMAGAEKLLGRGDMLFYPQGMSKPQRIQGAFIDDSEVERLVEFLKSRNEAEYEEEIMEDIEKKFEFSQEDCDELLPEAIDIVIDEQQASTSFLQRRLRVGYARAARIIDQMEERGIVGPPEGNRGRKVLLSREDIDGADS